MLKAVLTLLVMSTFASCIGEHRTEVDIQSGQARILLNDCNSANVGEPITLVTVDVVEGNQSREICRLTLEDDSREMITGWNYGQPVAGYKLSSCERLLPNTEYVVRVKSGRHSDRHKIRTEYDLKKDKSYLGCFF